MPWQQTRNERLRAVVAMAMCLLLCGGVTVVRSQSAVATTAPSTGYTCQGYGLCCSQYYGLLYGCCNYVDGSSQYAPSGLGNEPPCRSVSKKKIKK